MGPSVDRVGPRLGRDGPKQCGKVGPGWAGMGLDFFGSGLLRTGLGTAYPIKTLFGTVPDRLFGTALSVLGTVPDQSWDCPGPVLGLLSLGTVPDWPGTVWP